MRERHHDRAERVCDLDLSDPRVDHAARFLSRFGYLPAERAHDPEQLQNALRLYQRFYDLAPTGELTLETIKHQRRYRCANPDPVQALVDDGTATADPIVYFGDRWNHRDLTFFLDNFTSDLTGEAAIVQAAFDVWAGVVPLTFTRVFDPGSADITVSWEIFDHGDGTPFDGPGNVLAHADSPSGQNAAVHFDDSENWTAARVLSTGIHEIGHALGLHHSREPNSVMFATENGVSSLHELDIKGIRSRYPDIVHMGSSQAARVSLWGLKTTGGCDVKRVVFEDERPRLAWVQRTMVDPLTDFDRDNAWIGEIIEVDESRIDTRVSGGDHWGSPGSPNNVHQGAVAANARSITFRISATHTSDLDLFGVGCVVAV